MRCPDCNKFVAYDTEVEPEEQDAAYDGETLTVELRRVLACEQCGTELKEATFSLEEPLELEHTQECLDHALGKWIAPDELEPEPAEEPDYEVTVDAEPTMRFQTHDRHGKPIKRSRYQRTYYGVSVTVTVECERCEARAEAILGDELQASAFDELT
jgi:hypothetical protein